MATAKRNQPAKKEREQILAGFESKAKKLSAELKTVVTFETFTKEDGSIIVAYIKQPNPIAAARCMDMLYAGKIFEAGMMLWGACFIKEHSSAEVEDDKYKLGLSSKLGTLVDIQMPDLKKN